MMGLQPPAGYHDAGHQASTQYDLSRGSSAHGYSTPGPQLRGAGIRDLRGDFSTDYEWS